MGFIVNNHKKIELIEGIIQRIKNLQFKEDNTLNSIIQEGKMLVNRIFGEDSQYINSIQSTMFYSLISPSSIESDRVIWFSGQESLLNTFKTMKRELEIFNDNSDEEIDSNQNGSVEMVSNMNKVFLVHGHDEGMKQSVARTVEKLGLEAIILSEQDDEGFTVIEKFEKHAQESIYAIILLSPDDIGYKRNEQENNKFRARQNVILELGYFIGTLSRKSVLALVKDDPAGELEIPSDIAGVLYTPFDMNDGWKLKLIAGLKNNGYEVNVNKIL